jgi:hypothetical protein
MAQNKRTEINMSDTNENANRELAVVKPAEMVRMATDVAGLCKEIVLRSAITINGKKYVPATAWEAIATAHGCIASSRDVEKIEGGLRAIGELKRQDTGSVIATAEGFVGEDEPKWANGPEYARRGMVQTRAVSRVCKQAFAHVVVLMNAGLETTPLEEVPDGGFQNDRQERRESEAKVNGERPPEKFKDVKRVMESTDPVSWREIEVHFGKNKGVMLGQLEPRSLNWYAEEWLQKKLSDIERPPNEADKTLIIALTEYKREMLEHARRMKETVSAEVEEEPLPF